MSFGNSSKPMVELGQIQHGEETQYQLRPAQEGCVPTLDNQSNMPQLFKSFEFGNGSRISDENLVILEFKYLQNKKW